MKKKNMNRGQGWRRLLAACLCAAFLCGSACAENAVDLANTENHDGFLGFCQLPDGGLVLAGYTEIHDESGPDKGRIVCLNPDRSVRWVYTDPDAFSYGTVVVTKDGAIAAFYYDGVKFFISFLPRIQKNTLTKPWRHLSRWGRSWACLNSGAPYTNFLIYERRRLRHSGLKSRNWP